MNAFQTAAAKTALKHMFEKDYYDICTVDKLIKMTGCHPDRKDYQALNALHCVHFNEMDSDLRQMVYLKTIQIFDTEGFDTDLIGGLFNDTKQLNRETRNCLGLTFVEK